MTSTIGFVGLGTMGLPMAINLVKAGHQVRGFDVVTEQVEKARENGIEIVPSAAEAASGATVLITMLPKGDHVRQVLLADDGPLSTLEPSGVVIDCSTIDVATSRAVHEAGAALNIDVLDAPVSGGVGGATEGTLTFMVGGSAEVLDSAQYVFDIMGAKTVHCGGPGAGQVAKTCNQLVFGTNLVAVSEAFVLAKRLGLSDQKLFDVLSTSSGNSWVLNNFCPRPGLVGFAAANNDYAPRFAAALLAKDLGLAETAADSASMELHVAKSARELVDQLALVNGGLDCSAVIKVIDPDEQIPE
ncbi:3-hydroxyisobutyrate dehydrogenase [Rhodococcus wratislaviensis]|uniref:3-hydroxyisobutyrate dehydrogenase n=1 Tax=Rhodococcus wratislaviensis TaxID=44752 RepID=A0A402C2Y3_RHOWR|nr:3-hydroxyisobutyrate dehydrogenase [Rhodococcus wratislaviensis]GCE37923.2 3-hydroxyisobutyrate dehydrogenase [Rhodococcus wratislaviensis]